jgi:hypothetical protein
VVALIADKPIVGTGKLLFCTCERGPSGTIADAPRHRRCLWDFAEVLYDGPAGSSKTFSDLARIYALMVNYPGVRILGLRRTLKACRESIQVTFEDHILGPGHPWLDKGGSREHRSSYTNPANGAHFAIGGTDDIEQHLSSEWDLGFFFEATQPGMVEYDWVTIGTRMRGVAIPHPHCDFPDGVYTWSDRFRGKKIVDIISDRFPPRVVKDGRSTRVEEKEGPRLAASVGGKFCGAGCDDRNVPLFFRQRVAECNPSIVEGEQHWLMKRYKARLMARITACHADNPRADAAYLNELKAMPEPFRSVYYDGKWVSVEGKCWPSYNPERHYIAGSFKIEPSTGRKYVTVTEPGWCEGGRAKVFPIASVVAGYDWGINRPGSLQVLAITPDKRAFRVAEILRSEATIEDWAGWVVELVDKFAIEAILCDPSARAIWQLFNQRLGPRQGRTVGGICQAGDNTRGTEAWVQGGIDLVRTMFSQDRLILLADCHHGPVDPVLRQKRLPIGLHEEIPGYVLARDKSNPDRILPYPDRDCRKDGCDALRYVCMDVFEADRYVAPRIIQTFGHMDPNIGLTGAEELELRRKQELLAPPRAKPKYWSR